MESKPTMIYLDVLDLVFEKIKASPVMKELYGDDILRYLGMFPLGTEMKIADSGQAGLSKEQEQIFVNELQSIMVASMKELKGL